jgi:hypothetical protein
MCLLFCVLVCFSHTQTRYQCCCCYCFCCRCFCCHHRIRFCFFQEHISARPGDSDGGSALVAPVNGAFLYVLVSDGDDSKREQDTGTDIDMDIGTIIASQLPLSPSVSPASPQSESASSSASASTSASKSVRSVSVSVVYFAVEGETFIAPRMARYLYMTCVYDTHILNAERACVCVCLRACVFACVRVCVRACLRVSVACVFTRVFACAFA